MRFTIPDINYNRLEKKINAIRNKGVKQTVITCGKEIENDH